MDPREATAIDGLPRPGKLVGVAGDHPFGPRTGPPPVPTWHEQRIDPCPECGLFHDPADHRGGHRHAYPALFEPCICGDPHPRVSIRWPYLDGAWLEVATVKAIATGNHVEPIPRLVTKCRPAGLPGRRSDRRRDRRRSR